MKVLVRSIHRDWKRDDDYFVSVNEDDYPGFSCEEFHMVDLKASKLHRDIVPPLLSCTIQESMVALDEVIYVIGGVRRRIESFNPPEGKEHLFYQNSKCNVISEKEDEVSKRRKWDELPVPINNASWPVAVSLLGKIYSFGSFALKPEVYDPSVGGGWQQLSDLPFELLDSVIDVHVVPDPSNKRILVHLEEGPNLDEPSLYAFYPYGDGDGDAKWKCLDPSFHAWENVMAVSDDVLLFHDFEFPNLMLAYDLRTCKWLNVVWKNPSIRSLVKATFPSMFARDDGSLCLAHYGPFYMKNKPKITYLYFLKFTAERCPKDTDVVYLTARRMQEFILENTSQVLDFLPLN